MSKNYTLEISASPTFEWADKVGFTTGNVNDNNVKRNFQRLANAAKAGKITPVRAGQSEDEKVTVIACYLRVRESDSENQQSASFALADGTSLDLNDAADDLV